MIFSRSICMSMFNKDQVQKWINDYWRESKNCQICGSNDWLLLDNVWELRDFRGGDVASGGPVLPVVALMCNVCGHTLFFNAIAVRAVERPASREGKDE
jgi:hypothetical protein